MTDAWSVQPGYWVDVYGDTETRIRTGTLMREKERPPLCLTCQGWTWPDLETPIENMLMVGQRTSLSRQLKGGEVSIQNIRFTKHAFAALVDRPEASTAGELGESRQGWIAVYDTGERSGEGHRERCAGCRCAPSEGLISGAVSIRLERPMEEALAATRPLRRGTDLTDQQLVEWWAEKRGVVPSSWL